MYLHYLRAIRCAVISIALLGSLPSGANVITTPYYADKAATPKLTLPMLPYASAKAQKGGKIIFAADGTFNNLNSMNGLGNVTEGVHYLFDSLLSKSMDEPGVFYPLLAEKITYNPKQTDSAIFHIHPQAKFNDGSALTAQDVKFSFDLYQQQANFGLQMYLSGLKRTEVISPTQVKMYFQGKHQPEMISIVGQMPIYAQKEWQSRLFKQLSLKPILGSGPYRIQNVTAGRQITYQRNPHYWARNVLVNRGRYNFDQIQYRYYRSPELKFEALKRGDVSFFQDTEVSRWMTAYNFPAMQQQQLRRYRFTHQNPIATQSLIFNQRRAPFNDLRLRQALSYAYDFEWLNKVMLYGQYQRLNSFFSNSELSSNKALSPKEKQALAPYLKQLHPIQAHWVQRDWRYPQSDASGLNRNGLLKARELLLQAGYFYKNGQLLTPKGERVRLEILLHDANEQKMLLPYIRHLKRLGVQASLRLVDTNQYYERLRHYQYDMILDRMPQSLTPGQEQQQFWGSQASQQDGNYNYAGIQNPVIDAMLAKLMQANDREDVVLYTQLLDRLLRAGFYHIPTYGTGEQWYVYQANYQRPPRAAKLNVAIDYWWVQPTVPSAVKK